MLIFFVDVDWAAAFMGILGVLSMARLMRHSTGSVGFHRCHTFTMFEDEILSSDKKICIILQVSMRCSGPCLPHCYTCPASTVMLANVAFVYTIACICYIFLTRNIGTPFLDSLTVEQLRIKKQSAVGRRRAFLSGIAVGIVSIVLWRPFRR